MRATVVVLAAVLACGRSESSEEAPAGGVSAAASCSEPLRVSGTLRTNVADVPLDGAYVTRGFASYKYDVDAAEARCVDQFSVRIEAGGCQLEMLFGSHRQGRGLVHIAFEADSGCPGFWDAVEGAYARHWVDGPVFAPRWPEGLPPHVDAVGESVACAGGATVRFPGMAFTLTTPLDVAPVRLLHVDLSDVVFTGDLRLNGYAGAVCLPVPESCGPDRHDGGDGFCVPLGTCSPGHPIDANGLCSPFPRL